MTYVTHTECEWDEDSDGVFNTKCGHTFDTIAGTLADNGIRFCPFCGKEIFEFPYEEDE